MKNIFLQKHGITVLACAIAIDVIKALKMKNIRTLFSESGLYKKKLVFAVHVQRQQKSNRTSDLQLMSELLAIRRALHQKKRLVKWAMVHKFYYLMLQWYRIKDCVNLSSIQLKKMAFLISLKRFQAAERMQVRFIISGNGVPSLAICIPTRYIHSHAGILHRDDYENTVKLIVEVIKKLDRDTVNKITFE